MMLIVDLGRTKLGIAFEHPRETKSDGRQQPVATKCQIFGIRDLGEPMLLSKGQADCSRLDNFCKAKGRKLALTRALDKLVTLTKAERTKVWEQYLNRPRTAPKPPAEPRVEAPVGTGTLNA